MKIACFDTITRVAAKEQAHLPGPTDGGPGAVRPMGHRVLRGCDRDSGMVGDPNLTA
jgi:hypothetical protein